MKCSSLEREARRHLNFSEMVRGGIKRTWARSLRDRMKLGKMEGCLGDGAGGGEEGI